MADSWTDDGRTKKLFCFPHPYMEETDRWTDARRTNGKIMLLSHTLTMRVSDVAGLVELRRYLGGDSVTDRWTDDGRTEK